MKNNKTKQINKEKTVWAKFPKLSEKEQKECDKHTRLLAKATIYALNHIED